jgi:hypothetical protein
VIVWSRLYGCLLAYLLAYMHLLFDFLDLLFGPSLALIPLALGYVIVRFIFMETLSLDPIRVYPTARKVRVQVGERERERERETRRKVTALAQSLKLPLEGTAAHLQSRRLRVSLLGRRS